MWVFTKFPMKKDELETALQRKPDRFEGVACPTSESAIAMPASLAPNVSELRPCPPGGLHRSIEKGYTQNSDQYSEVRQFDCDLTERPNRKRGQGDGGTDHGRSTERHFVTAGASAEVPSLPQDHKHFQPVTRRFQPDPNVLEKLVEVLWQLLMNSPDCEIPATCISGAAE